MKIGHLLTAMVLLNFMIPLHARAEEKHFNVNIELTLNSAKLTETENASGTIRFRLGKSSIKKTTTIKVGGPLFKIRITPDEAINKLVDARFEKAPSRNIVLNKWYEIPFEVGLMPTFSNKIPVSLRPAKVLLKGNYRVSAEVTFPYKFSWSMNRIDLDNINIPGTYCSTQKDFIVTAEAAKPLNASII